MDTTLQNIVQNNFFDILLVVISGFACFYCWSLSRRLKKLQSLDSGLGGSIVKLTKAIAQTNKAALEARQSTIDTVATLKALLRSAEDTLPQIEARLESLRHSQRAAQNKHDELDAILKKSVDPALKNAHATSQALLRIVSEVQDYERKTKKDKAA